MTINLLRFLQSADSGGNDGKAFTQGGGLNMDTIISILIATAVIIVSLGLCLLAYKLCHVQEAIWKCWTKYKIKRLVRQDPMLNGAAA